MNTLYFSTTPTSTTGELAFLPNNLIWADAHATMKILND